MTHPTPPVADRLTKLAESHPRFTIDAFQFVLEALEHTARSLARQGSRRHVSGRELLSGLRELASQRFGFLARTVFAHWGLQATDDIGEIVFSLVDEELLSKQETDTPADFANVYSFEEVFEGAFLHP